MNQAEVINYCDRLLDVESFEDYCPNGMEVEGDGREVSLVVLGVSLTLELIEQALAKGADLILTHHGMLWKGADPRIRGPFAKKLKALLGAGLASASYHLPLDFHLELGNNAQLAKALGLKDIQPILANGGHFQAILGRPPLEDPKGLKTHIGQLLGQEPRWIDFGPERIERLAICSGGAQKYFVRTLAEGAQAFLTGEASEPNYTEAQEWGAHFIAGGHYATERLGIQALGQHLEETCGVKTLFVKTANPL